MENDLIFVPLQDIRTTVVEGKETRNLCRRKIKVNEASHSAMPESVDGWPTLEACCVPKHPIADPSASTKAFLTSLCQRFSLFVSLTG